MSGAFEQTIIIGNVGRDADTRFTSSGVQVTDFSVAVTTRYNSGDEQREKTKWYRVTAWRGLAETCAKYVKKGMSVMVSGTVQASAYMGQDGKPRASLDLTAREVQFLSRANDGNGGDAYAPPPQDDEAIPF